MCICLHCFRLACAYEVYRLKNFVLLFCKRHVADGNIGSTTIASSPYDLHSTMYCSKSTYISSAFLSWLPLQIFCSLPQMLSKGQKLCVQTREAAHFEMPTVYIDCGHFSSESLTQFFS